MHQLLYYRLAKRYEKPITLVKRISGEVDYSVGSAAQARTEHTIKAVVLPLYICSEFFKGLVSSAEKMQRNFFIQTASFDFNEDTYTIIYDGKSYNMKDRMLLSQNHWLITATAVLGEHHE